MKQLRGVDWRTLGMELFIVFVGLLAALQVDEWRELREYRETETRYLQRLRADLDITVDDLRSIREFMVKHRDGVVHVSESLQAGRILGDDVAAFEYGIIYVGHLPSTIVQRSAYDEMVASGMFARLESESLKRELANLYATHESVERNFSWWRSHVIRLSAHLDGAVSYYTEEGPLRDNFKTANEPTRRRVRFDFDTLSADREIRNGFYWAADTHDDWVEWTTILLETAEGARMQLEAELAERD